jgi:hypothetical protein
LAVEEDFMRPVTIVAERCAPSQKSRNSSLRFREPRWRAF